MVGIEVPKDDGVVVVGMGEDRVYVKSIGGGAGGGLDWVVLGAKSPRWGLNPPLLRQFSFGILRLSPKSSTVSARSSSE